MTVLTWPLDLERLSATAEPLRVPFQTFFDLRRRPAFR
jgi:hypothetical protein